MRKTGKVFAQLLTICSVLLLTVNVSFAQEEASKIAIQNSVTLGKVVLKENVTAAVNDLMMVPSSNGQVIGLTLHITNNGNSELNFIDYWINLNTKSGAKLTVQTENGSKITVPGKSSKDILFYAHASSTTKITDLTVKIIKWDFSSPSYSKVLGEITVPSSYNPVTGSDKGRMVNVGETKASFVVKQAVVGKSEKYYRPDVDLVIKNEGQSSLTLPDYQLYIQTNENLLYPLSVSNLKGTTLDPLTEKNFDLTASIPIAVKEGNWKLITMIPVNEGKDKAPIAQFELPKSSATIGNDLNKYYTFTNADGVYYIKLNSMNRIPIEDNDLVVANLTITNKGSETIPVPILTGKYQFNNSIQKSVNVSGNNKVIAIGPGNSIDVQISGIVPYTFDITKVDLIIQQKDAVSSEVTDLVTFTNKGTFNPIQATSAEQGFQITDVGYRSNVKISNFSVYIGTTANIIAAQIKVTNEEKRLADLQQLAGYYEKEDGTIYPATYQTISDKITPGGNALLFAWASVPKDADVEGLKLVVGKAVVQAAQGDSKQTEVIGYVSPYSFALPLEKKEQSELKKIDVAPYLLSMNRVRTQIDFVSATVKLDLDYTLEDNLLMKANTKDQKITIELVDDQNGKVFNKQFALSSSDEDSSTVRIGTHTLTASWPNEEDFVYLNTKFEDYTFNVYHEIQPGYKKLIASQKILWLVDRTISK